MLLTKSRLFFIFCSFFVLGVGIVPLLFRFSASVQDNLTVSLLKRDIAFQARIIETPIQRISHTTFLAKTILVEGSQMAFGDLLIITRLYPKYQKGDILLFDCSPKPPRAEYLASESSLSGVCIYPSLEKVGYSNQPLSFFVRIKDAFQRTINRVLPEPQASFLSGLILGARDAMDPDLVEAFRRTGTSHILALSGYNVAIIFSVLLRIMPFIGISRKRSFFPLVLSLLFFIFLVGPSPSLVRASIMSTLMLIASNIGRRSARGNILVGTAAFMLLIDPFSLHDIGFQLSFAATAGILYGGPVFQRLFGKDIIPHLFELFFSSFFAFLFTLPLIIYHFHTISFSSLLVNLLILPVIPFAMASGFLTAVVFLVFPTLPSYFAFLASLPLEYITRIVEFFAKAPLTSVDTGGVPWIFLPVYYFYLWYVMQNMIERCSSPHPLTTHQGGRNKPHYA
jgi:competence protein ComEC